MLINIRHPVTAAGTTARSTRQKTVAGMIETPYEIAELNLSDLEVSVVFEDGRTVYSRDGMFYRESAVAIPEAGVPLDTLSFAPRNAGDYRGFPDEFQEKLGPDFMSSGRDRYSPPVPALDIYGEGKYAQVRDYFEKAGAFEARATSYDEKDIDHWRLSAIRFMDNFRIVDGRMFERCHEPLLVAVPGSVEIASTSIFREHVDDRGRNSKGRSRRNGFGNYPEAHAFPLDRLEEASEFAAALPDIRPDHVEHLKGPMLSFEITGPLSSVSELADLETIRFLKLHDAEIETLSRMVARRSMQYRIGPSPELKAHLGSAEGLSGEIAGFEYLRPEHTFDIEHFRARLREIVALGRATDYGFPTTANALSLESLLANSEISLDRQDATPIEIMSVSISPRT